MTSLPSKPLPERPEADLVDLKYVGELIGFIFRSVRRHRLLSLFVSLATFGLSLVGLRMMPRKYTSDTTILTQTNQVMAVLGNPNRPAPEPETPTRAAYNTVLRHENLVALIKQTNLLDTWEESRAPILKLKDKLLATIRGPLGDDERLHAMVGLLARVLKVHTGEGTITIYVQWNDPTTAYRLVESAQQNFLEARHAAEISTIAEAISILEGHAANIHDSIEAALDEVRKLEGKQSASAVGLPRLNALGETKELTQLRVMLVAKQRAISDLEDFRRRRLNELQGQLAEQKALYTPAHPVIANTERSIASLSRDSPQIVSLKREADEIMREYMAHGGRDPLGTAPAAPPPAREGVQVIRREPQRTAADDDMAHARSRLEMSTRKYEDLLDRIDAARIALDTARAAFKYRYSVVRPASMPKEPNSPKPALFIAGGLIMAVFMSFGASTLKDILDGKVVERWQVERTIGLPVLSELGQR